MSLLLYSPRYYSTTAVVWSMLRVARVTLPAPRLSCMLHIAYAGIYMGTVELTGTKLAHQARAAVARGIS